MSKPVDKFLEAFDSTLESNLAEGVDGNQSMRRNSTENIKRGFEIFLDYLDSKNINSGHKFSEAVAAFNKKYPMKQLFSEVMDMLRKNIKWATRDGKLSGPANGPGLDSKFNTRGFEIFLTFAPEEAKKFKGLPVDKKMMYLPEGSAFLDTAESSNSEVIDYYEGNQDRLDVEWAEYVHEHDWGSGEDRIKITEDIFWEFIEDKMHEESIAKSENAKGMDSLQDMIDIQGASGNWDYDPYMHGLYNGLVGARDAIKGVEPEFRDPPEEWLSEIEAAIEVIDGNETNKEMEVLARFIIEAKWARKPRDIREVENYTTTRQSVKGLPEVDDFEIYDRDVDEVFPLGVSFTYDPPAKMFVLKTEEYGDYLVDTQGYDYARYVKKIIDSPKAQSSSEKEKLDEIYKKSLVELEPYWKAARESGDETHVVDQIINHYCDELSKTGLSEEDTIDLLTEWCYNSL